MLALESASEAGGESSEEAGDEELGGRAEDGAAGEGDRAIDGTLVAPFDDRVAWGPAAEGDGSITGAPAKPATGGPLQIEAGRLLAPELERGGVVGAERPDTEREAGAEVHGAEPLDVAGARDDGCEGLGVEQGLPDDGRFGGNEGVTGTGDALLGQGAMPPGRGSGGCSDAGWGAGWERA